MVKGNAIRANVDFSFEIETVVHELDVDQVELGVFGELEDDEPAAHADMGAGRRLQDLNGDPRVVGGLGQPPELGLHRLAIAYLPMEYGLVQDQPQAGVLAGVELLLAGHPKFDAALDLL